MHTNPNGGNAIGPDDARRLLAALLQGRTGPAIVYDVTVSPSDDDPYLTPAVIDAYRRLVDVRNGTSTEGPEMTFTMSAQEGGRLLQLVIEGAMAHAREHADGEPWFSCSTGLEFVKLGAIVYTEMMGKVEYR